MDNPSASLEALFLQKSLRWNLEVDTQRCTTGSLPYVRYDILSARSDSRWYCASLIHVISDNSVGVWTRQMIKDDRKPLDCERTYHFDPATFPAWLDQFFDDIVLEALSQP